MTGHRVHTVQAGGTEIGGVRLFCPSCGKETRLPLAGVSEAGNHYEGRCSHCDALLLLTFVVDTVPVIRDQPEH